MRLVTPKTLANRLVIALPFLTSLLIIASGPHWATWVMFAGFVWSAVVQALAGRIAPVMATHRSVASVWLLAFWTGPSSWVWCAVQIVTGSWAMASLVAPVVGYFGMTAWQRVTHPATPIAA